MTSYVQDLVKNKKGQITMFVIIGLVVFAIIFIALYLIQQAGIEDVPEETIVYDDARLNPVYQDIESCINQLTKEALQTMGRQAGYINLNPESLVYGVQNPANINNAVELFEGSGLIIPYWYGLSSNVRCEECNFYVNRPPLTGDSPLTVQSQIQNYIEDNIVSCTDALTRHENVFDINYGSPNAEVQFFDHTTVVDLDWPLTLEVRGEDTTFNVRDFSSETDVRMRDVYNIASDVLFQLIMSRGMLDNFAIEISNMAASGGIEGSIPPRSGGVTHEGGAPNFWLLSDVRDELRDEIANNVHYLQVQGTRDSFLIIEAHDRLQERFISGMSYNLITSNDYLSNLRIRFNYLPDWPLYVNVNPGRGELIMPTQDYSIRIPMFSISRTTYDFTYDMSFPVLVTVEDVEAFDGEGFILQFVAEANIRHSQRYAEDIIFNEPEADEFESGFSDPASRIVNVTVFVENEHGVAPSEEITVEYTCMGETVALGRTVVDEGRAIVKSRLPTCIDGYFSVRGPRFYSDQLRENVVEGIDNVHTLTVYEESDVNIELRARDVVPDISSRKNFEDGYRIFENWTLATGTSSPLFEENIIIIFNRMIDGEPSEFYRALEYNASESQSVGLVPGQYSVLLQSTLELDEDFKTKDMTVHNPGLIEGWLTGQSDPAVINGTNLNKTLFAGLLQIDDESGGFLDISSEDINRGTMRIYYPRVNYERDIEYTPDLEALAFMIEFSEKRRDLLTPEFVN